METCAFVYRRLCRLIDGSFLLQLRAFWFFGCFSKNMHGCRMEYPGSGPYRETSGTALALRTAMSPLAFTAVCVRSESVLVISICQTLARHIAVLPNPFNLSVTSKSFLVSAIICFLLPASVLLLSQVMFVFMLERCADWAEVSWSVYFSYIYTYFYLKKWNCAFDLFVTFNITSSCSHSCYSSYKPLYSRQKKKTETETFLSSTSDR